MYNRKEGRIQLLYQTDKRVIKMRKRITTSIEETALKELDIKIINSDHLKDRSAYFEFLIKLLPFIPDDVRPETDINEILRKIYIGSGSENGGASLTQQHKEDSGEAENEAEQAIYNMAKNFKLKITPKETPT